MPIVMNMRWAGVTPQQYDEVRDLADWEGDLPAGGKYHAAFFDDAGLRVNDVWASAEDFNAFVETRLMPAVQKVGVAGEPVVEIYPVHAIFAPDPA